MRSVAYVCGYFGVFHGRLPGYISHVWDGMASKFSVKILKPAVITEDILIEFHHRPIIHKFYLNGAMSDRLNLARIPLCFVFLLIFYLATHAANKRCYMSFQKSK